MHIARCFDGELRSTARKRSFEIKFPVLNQIH